MAFNRKEQKFCSFCGSSEGPMVQGPNGVAICDVCAAKCNNLFNGRSADDCGDCGDCSFSLPDPLPTPKELKEYPDKFVIGQEKAKEALSVAVYNHYKRIKYEPQMAEQGIELDKSNILMVGPTGTGKTLLARTLAKRLSVPFAIADATTITEAGYVGEDVENILLKLIQAADGNVEAAEKGIIFLDEVDKIAKKGENVSITRDVSGEGVQQALLKIIEGTIASVPPQGGRKHPGQEMIRINTKDILFICGGAFVGLDKVIEKRLDTASIGFGKTIVDSSEKDLEKLFRSMLPDDLIKFGLIPEFIGRLPVHVSLNNLKVEDLERIITEPSNSILKQYQASLKLDGVTLEFTKDAVHAVAKTAFDQKTGARGIRSIIEQIMTDLMYEVPSVKGLARIEIGADCIEGGASKALLFAEDGSRVSLDATAFLN